MKLSHDMTTHTFSHTRWIYGPKRRVSYHQIPGELVRRIITAAENAGLSVNLTYRLTHLGVQLGSMCGRLDAISFDVANYSDFNL